MASSYQNHQWPPPLPAQQQYAYEQPESRSSRDREAVTIGKHGVFFEYKTFIAVIVGIGAMLVWGSAEFNEIHYNRKEDRAVLERIPDKVLQTVKEATIPINQRLMRLENDIAISGISRYTRSDHEVWCLNTEKKNAKIGWECANIGDWQGSVRGHDLRRALPKPPALIPNSLEDDWRTRIFGTAHKPTGARL